LSALRQLPIINPKLEDIQLVAPHLTVEQIERNILHSDFAHFVTPPVHVRNRFSHISYRRDFRNRPAMYGPYVHGTSQLSSELDFLLFKDEASAYAEAHWPDSLILDRWKGAARFYVQDPLDLDEDRYPRTMFRIYATTSCTYEELCELWRAQTDLKSTVLNNVLMEMTTDPLIGEELIAGHSSWSKLNCSICGGGFKLTRCSGCGSIIRDNGIRVGDSMPLPVKMIELLQSAGHVFQIDPYRNYVREHEVLVANRAGISEEEMDHRATSQK
jgi:hypothetical protein